VAERLEDKCDLTPYVSYVQVAKLMIRTTLVRYGAESIYSPHSGDCNYSTSTEYVHAVLVQFLSTSRAAQIRSTDNKLMKWISSCNTTSTNYIVM
jgi:hypothetical protein